MNASNERESEETEEMSEMKRNIEWKTGREINIRDNMKWNVWRKWILIMRKKTKYWEEEWKWLMKEMKSMKTMSKKTWKAIYSWKHRERK